ncbi:MAG: GWxTD domain-containing protein [Ignavibacteriae bacterium]|nr:GWxTD domain-containing protein [Ignavibacteriota bacterium]
MKKICTIVLIALIFGCVAQSQTIIPAKSDFRIEIDWARFQGDSTQAYIELYYGIRERALSYKADGGRFVAGARFSYTIMNEQTTVASREWTVPNIIDDTTRLETGQTLVGIETFGLPAGSYQLIIQAYDMMNELRRDSLRFSFPVSLIPQHEAALSDIELCTSLQQSSNTQSMFYKNTVEAVPNPSLMYGTGLPMMFYYVEVYNLLKSVNGEKVTLRTQVFDSGNKEALVQNKQKQRTNNASVEVDKVNVSSLKSGTYTLQVSVLDSAEHVYADMKKKFFILKPGSEIDTTQKKEQFSLVLTEFTAMGEKELDNEFAEAEYLAHGDEKEQYGQLTDVEAKRRFVAQFWQKRDPDQSTAQNELRIEYRKRIERANELYARGFVPGWKTERGRVFIVYGPCDDVERFTSTEEANPYEVWHYNSLQGGVVFVFVDWKNIGDFILVHSTYRQEQRNDNWYEEYAQKMRH